MANSTGGMVRTVQIDDPADPRLADYADVKERQHDGAFGPSGSGDPCAPFGKFYAEGKVVLRHLVRSGYTTLSVLATQAQAEANTADLSLLPPHVPVYTLAHDLMERVIGFTIHRGLLAVGARKRPMTTDQLLNDVHGVLGPMVVLEDLSNHDNVGGIFRNAAALGASGVLLSPRCADPLYRKSLRVSVGLALRIPWAIAGDWPGDLRLLHAAGVETLAMTPNGNRMLSDVGGDAGGAGRRLALMIGAEGPGLTPEAMAQATHRVSVPMAQGVDSLNAATACAVALYEISRLRGTGGGGGASDEGAGAPPAPRAETPAGAQERL